MITIRNLTTAEAQMVDSLNGIDLAVWEVVDAPLPSDAALAAGVKFDGTAWVPSPRRLTRLQILGLYTTAQHARLRRMLIAVYPVGHPQAGQLIDPDGMVQRALDATLAMPGTISTDDPRHINGTMLMRAVGGIESDAELARILAGITPEEAAQ